MPPPVIAKDQRPLPDWPTVHQELKRPGVALQLLWEEYRGQHPQEYGYSRFCELYRAWAKRLSPTTRQTHVAGERLLVDYTDTRLQVFDAATGGARGSPGERRMAAHSSANERAEICYLFATFWLLRKND
jgi:transposase